MTDFEHKKELSIFDKNQLIIARKTLKMVDVMVEIMGGMTKKEAEQITKKQRKIAKKKFRKVAR